MNQHDASDPSLPEEAPFTPANPDDYVAGWAAAAKYSGWSDTHLKDLVRKGELAARKGAPVPPFNMTPHYFAKADLEAIKRVPLGVAPTAPAASAPPTARLPQNQQQAREPRTGLASVIGSAERVKVYKRNETTGKLDYIAAYNHRDVAQARDIETFIQTYLVPTYKTGEYEVELWNGDKQTRTTTVTILGRGAVDNLGESNVDVNELMKTVATQIAEAQSRAPVQPTLAEQAAQMKAMQEAFGGGGNQMMPLMLLMMQQRPTGPDPTVQALMGAVQALTAKVEQLASAPPPAVLPPPMPAEPAIDVIKLMDAVKGMIPVPPPPAPVVAPPQMGIKDYLALLPLAENLIAKFSGKEMLEGLLGEMAELREERKKGGLKETLDNIRALREVAALDPFRKDEGKSADSFWDVVRDLASDSKLDKIKDIVAGARSGPPPAHAGAAPRGGGGRARGPAGSAGVAGGVTEEEAPAQETPPSGLPVEVPALVRKLEGATNDLGRIKGGLAIFRTITAQPDFRWAAERVLELAKLGEKEKLLSMVGEFLGGLQEPAHGGLSNEAMRATMEAFRTNIDRVIGVLLGHVKLGPQPKETKVEATPPAPKNGKAKTNGKATKATTTVVDAAPEPVAATVVEGPEVIDDEGDEDDHDAVASA